jgi:predicted ATPase
MRDDLPNGTVTFLFTDVEGSTKLLHSLGADAYADALAEHRRVFREACAAEAGVEVDTLVLPTIADAIGAEGDVARHIGDAQCLLFFDNFEQMVDAAPELAALAGECPRLRLLVTSREALRIAVEREYPLSPLPESPSVELFGQRAGAVAPEIEIEYETAAAICDRLDRLPLAIELAAARCKALSGADPRPGLREPRSASRRP